jgi:hypothetical protein
MEVLQKWEMHKEGKDARLKCKMIRSDTQISDYDTFVK